ncbi:ectoine/hydroxyectoine ABC transporter permease subunit EhuC [Mesorhizobium sp. B4-1-4]|uniref:ectoine/hydroxyectoine ABC transporter permease subunit EhuC n=1 Tax=Mesorhizobium sp. B4-1-4 TaxID=2589888 RepID=UPI00112A5A54|nr:ectoine/hydroxyectoine ABC transporter permease subunit EhuC [Mesorhizobium sp. B4-1-4]UCI31795.1 ectoine/hydroxyectoine ABC transporter permease subunit EhuC [Mesorhizobium sp. B4-1-4]
MSLWKFVEQYWPKLLNGTIVTLEQFLAAAILTVSVSTLFGLMKLSGNSVFRSIAVVYIEFFRGTSLLVQLYWMYFVLPVFGFPLEKFTAGFVALGLNAGAYGAELVRGGIQAVPAGQWEAAYALSLSPSKRMWRIILPQALLIMLPPWGNLLIDVLKGTALVSLIAVADLMFQVNEINQMTYLSAQAFGTALLIYYVLARVLLTPSLRWLEARLRRKLSRD